jgi:site-specific recombinase
MAEDIHQQSIGTCTGVKLHPSSHRPRSVSLPDSLVASWADIFRPSKDSIPASCKIIALRATNIALSRDLIEFADDEDITKSSFFNLPTLVDHVVRHSEDFDRWDDQLAACEEQLQSVNRLLAEKGSSADLIFRVRLLRSLLGRIQQVISLEMKRGVNSRSTTCSRCENDTLSTGVYRSVLIRSALRNRKS